ncbi:MAG: hypothetical protein RIT45_1262 [Pseudomonadota bacterium]|jgi:hypothetical protein
MPQHFVRLLLPFALFAVALAPTCAFADGEVVAEDLEKKAQARTKADDKADSKRKDGWTKKLGLGANGSATSSSSVVGAVDGTTYQIGVLLDGEFNLVSGRHDWQNSLKVQHAQTRTPAVAAWLKSADNFELQSTWLYRLEAIDWVGPFARARLQTQLWRGETVRAGETIVERTPAGGTATSTTVAAETSIDLTSAFEPVIVAETAGFFANPFEGKSLTLHAKLGAGGQHIFSQGGYAMTAFDDATNTLKLAEIETTHQVGGELELEAKGEVNANVKWMARTRLFYPFVTKSEQALTGVDAMTTELQGGLSVKLAKWASLDYVVNVKRIPLVVDVWQVQHGLLLTTGFNLL